MEANSPTTTTNTPTAGAAGSGSVPVSSTAPSPAGKCHSLVTGSGSSSSSCPGNNPLQPLPQSLLTTAIASTTGSSISNSIELLKQDDVNNLSLASGLSEGQRSLSGAPSASSSPILSPQGKIFGRNANGTLITTSRPSNEAEVQLYRVLQRASLLAYYDTLLEMGGDDVQQLYDAGEEEFLEIMALVGMASKPLHVRRLQKALHEWANNPGLFQGPMLPHLGLCETPTKPAPAPALVFGTDGTPALPRNKFAAFQPAGTPQLAAQIGGPAVLCPALPVLQSPTATSLVLPAASNASNASSAGASSAGASSAGASCVASCVTGTSTAHQVSSSSPQLTPVLTDLQVQRITMCAEKIARQLPQREPRAQTSKKRTTRELEQVIAMAEHDPRRMDEIRKYSAIYGRFDCKRRPEKPLTLHEVCVNEAAAQLCRNPQTIWLLTRRDELFPLARQIVKDAGFGHSASIARYGNLLSQMPGQAGLQRGSGAAGPGGGAAAAGAVSAAGAGTGAAAGAAAAAAAAAAAPGSVGSAAQSMDLDCESSDTASASVLPSVKRQRLSSTEVAQLPIELNREAVEDSRYNLFAMYQKFAKPPFDLTEIAKFSLGKSADFEDNDSRFSFSNSSSPPMPGNGLEGERSPLSSLDACPKPGESLSLAETVDLTTAGVQVISAAGDNIIAVANPALALSPTLNEVLKRNAASPEA